MKALVYLGNKTLSVMDVPEPVAKKGELLLKIKACGICGSDVHGWLGLTGRRIPPMVMGHEFSAEVVGLGEGCSGRFNLGDIVTVQPCISCGVCVYCLSKNNNLCPSRKLFGTMDFNGAFQEYLAVPEVLAFHLPSNISYSVGALTEALAVSYSGIKKAGDLSNKNVVIIGAGTIGLLALAVVKTQNPNSVIVTDLSTSRLEMAKKLGADVVLNPSNINIAKEVSSVFGDKLADVTIEAVGVGATALQSIESLAPMGKSVWIGNSAKNVEIDMQSIVTRGLCVLGSYIYTHEEFGESVQLIQELNQNLDMFISSEVSLIESPGIFEELARDTEKYLKCVVKF